MTELREIVTDEVARLKQRDEEVWEAVEKPQLQDWCSGVDMDLGPEGTRLRRYEAAADRLFRSAWTKLERLREASGQPLIHRAGHVLVPEHATSPLPPRRRRHPRPQCRCARCPRFRGRRSSAIRRGRCSTSGPAARRGPGTDLGSFSQNKTNPAPSRPAKGGRAALLRNIL